MSGRSPRRWIGRMVGAPATIGSAPRIRKEFTLATGHGAVASASIAASALGIFELSMNGRQLGDEVLAPGWTAYEWRVRYLNFDVLDLIGERNALALQLGNGWFASRMFITDEPAYGQRPAGLVELVIVFEDGHVQIVGTDDSWKAGESPTMENSIYDGQTIDARREDRNWTRPAFDDRAWVPVEIIDFDHAILEERRNPPLRRQEVRSPLTVTRTTSGTVVIDYGQNLVGWLRVRVQGERGAELTLRHAEVLEGERLGTRPLRSALATDRFILSGGVDEFEPTLTFHGFRYVEIDGWPEAALPEPGAIEAVIIGSDLRRRGTFASSHAMLNRLHENVVWSTRGNFVSVPTDCPQRDERLGWTGDIAVFAPTAAYLFDTSHFLEDWMRDLVLEQKAADGVVPFVVPDVLKRYSMPADFPDPAPTAIWGDAVAWVPWAAWIADGDREVVVENYPAVLDHVRRVSALLASDFTWSAGFQWGDWLDPDAPPEDASQSKTDPYLVATAAFHRTLTIAVDMARILDRPDVEELISLRARVRAGFASRYVRGERLTSDSTTAYALAIHFDLLDGDARQWAGERLAALVRASGHVISTGFAGTPYICDALASTGNLDDAYALLLQTECPSWLYPVTMGATTIWERWDSMLPDGTINPGEMTSFNHYALGAVADWMHRVVAGITPLEAGYRSVLIAPQPGGGLSWAEGERDTPYGLIRSRWEREGDSTYLETTIPEGVHAIVRAPDGQEWVGEPGTHRRAIVLPTQATGPREGAS